MAKRAKPDSKRRPSGTMPKPPTSEYVLERIAELSAEYKWDPEAIEKIVVGRTKKQP